MLGADKDELVLWFTGFLKIVSLCILGAHGTCCVDQAGLQFTGPTDFCTKVLLCCVAYPDLKLRTALPPLPKGRNCRYATIPGSVGPSFSKATSFGGSLKFIPPFQPPTPGRGKRRLLGKEDVALFFFLLGRVVGFFWGQHQNPSGNPGNQQASQPTSAASSPLPSPCVLYLYPSKFSKFN